MVDAKLHDRIEKYLLGKLSPTESAKIEAQIASDPTLLEQVEIQRIGLIGLQQLAADDLRRKFAEWDAELDANQAPQPETSTAPKTKINTWMWVSIALFILLAVALVLYFQQLIQSQKTIAHEIAQRDSVILLLQNEIQQKDAELSVLKEQTPTGNDSLAQKDGSQIRESQNQAPRDLQKPAPSKKPQIAMQYAPSYSAPSLRGDFSSDDPVLDRAVKLFEAQSYSESARVLKSIPGDDPRQAQVNRMLPYALFYGKEFQAAIPAFENLMKIDRFEVMSAQWHLLLCYVAEGQDDRARKLLDEVLKNPEHKYYKDAVKLHRDYFQSR